MPQHAPSIANRDLPEPYDLSGVVFPCTRPLRRLRQRLMVKFPKDVATADRRFAQLWDDDYPINGDWLNRFAETSAQAMVRRDERTLNGHLAVMLNAYQRGGAYLRNLIDVNYMEDLFYQIEDADAQWGWRRVPPPLRQLYIDMWSGLITKFVTRLQPPDAASL